MRGREAPRPPGGTETPTNNNPQMSPLRITHDGEFYARLLTKEITSGGSLGANPHSFRYYGPGPGSVPFGWESQPGTPKDAPCCRTLLQAPGAGPAVAVADVLPAITPPPSYHLRPAPPDAHSGRMSGRKKMSKGGGNKSKCCYCGCGYYSKKLKWSVVKIGFIAAVFRRIALGKSRVSSAPSVQSSSSSSTRWLFSGSSSQEAESGVYDHHYDHYEAPATKGVLRLGLGMRQTPWMVQFCGGRREAGWVHGWP